MQMLGLLHTKQWPHSSRVWIRYRHLKSPTPSSHLECLPVIICDVKLAWWEQWDITREFYCFFNNMQAGIISGWFNWTISHICCIFFSFNVLLCYTSLLLTEITFNKSIEIPTTRGERFDLLYHNMVGVGWPYAWQWCLLLLLFLLSFEIIKYVRLFNFGLQVSLIEASK